MIRFTVLTLFPEIVEAYFAASIMARAVKGGKVDWRVVNIRDFALDKHHSCDDAPYGGGAGMLMLPEPLGLALESAGVRPKPEPAPASRRTVYLSPGGRLFGQALAAEYARLEELVLVCGRYEGVDQRVIDRYIDEEVSIGDYVLSSGEVAALAVIDSVYRLVEEVISPESLGEESFSWGGEGIVPLLEYPQYTRPEVYAMMKAPEVLLSGHHENIRRWRLERMVEKTLRVRPDLIEKGLREGKFNGETRKLIEKAAAQGLPGGNDGRDKGDRGLTDEGKPR